MRICSVCRVLTQHALRLSEQYSNGEQHKINKTRVRCRFTMGPETPQEIMEIPSGLHEEPITKSELSFYSNESRKTGGKCTI